jgi:hypothetical protein
MRERYAVGPRAEPLPREPTAPARQVRTGSRRRLIMRWHYTFARHAPAPTPMLIPNTNITKAMQQPRRKR